MATNVKHMLFFSFVSCYTEAGMITYIFPESNKCSTCLNFAAFLVLHSSSVLMEYAGFPEMV